MASSRKRFYLKKYLRFTYLLNIAVMLVVVLFLTWVWSLPAADTFGLFTGQGNFSVLYLVLGLVTFFACFSLVTMLIMGITHLVSRLDLSDAGLDYLYWPYVHINCSWNDVQAITKRKEVVQADIILLKRASETGLPITMTLRRILGLDTQYFIPLNILDGWPSGALAQELRDHAPQLFQGEQK